MFTPRLHPSNERQQWPDTELSGSRKPGVEAREHIGPDGGTYTLLRAPCTLPVCYCDIIAIPESAIIARFVCGPEDPPQEATMTVREAFAKAGYPVPEGAFMTLKGMSRPLAWKYSYKKKDFIFQQLRGVWAWDSAGNTNSLCDVNLSNLPAVDAFDALPKCVQEVIER